MPIVKIECLTSDSETYSTQQVQSLANQLGDIFEAPAGTTWLTISYSDRDNYAENHSNDHEAMQPTMVSVLHRKLPGENELAKQAMLIARAVEAILQRPSTSVHVVFEPEGRGRIAFGGELVRS